ncbi:hypothetical protein [Paenarthrobacter sp. 2TAF44]|uniref:hypothetical protein n=1 Tax=Paenarthrobacter sp. 2TAF44 TaxID=3233018 RepID=UPI003F97EB98
MAERGNSKHGPHLDDQMQHETEGMIRGNKPSHVEEGRETEPFPDETDAQEVREALNPNTPADAAAEEGGSSE